MLPKSGSSFPKGRVALTDTEFAQVIAAALKREFGTPRKGIQQITKWTGVSDRTAKNWWEAKNAPRGAHLVILARESDAVMKDLILLAERPEMSLGASLHALRRLLSETMAALDQMM